VSHWDRSEASDEDLVRRARDGDEAALGALVRRHSEAVYRVALSIAGDPDLAQDVSQDAFLKAFRALRGFRGEAAFRTWLLTIAANTARGALRRQGRRRETDIDSAPPVASQEKAPDENAELSSESVRARRALARLPEKQRLSIQLRVDEGLSFREIGELIGSTEGAARVNYFHGIRKLREWME
jgi:RNA polymerase sigma-70 factor (ECF subfamily)